MASGTSLQVFLCCAVLIFVPTVSARCGRPPRMRRGNLVFKLDWHSDPVEKTTFRTNYRIDIECNPGFIIQGEEFFTCLPSGVWSPRGRCIVGQLNICATPDLANGVVEVNHLREGGQAEYSCNDGYKIRGESIRECQSDGTWSRRKPVCIALLVCEDPGQIRRGQRITTRGRQGRDGVFSFNAVISYSCHNHYIMRGNNVLTCSIDENGDGFWSGDEPVCEIVKCEPFLEAIDHGSSDAENRTYGYGESISFECRNGYRAIGRTWRVCSERDLVGYWEGTTPRCEVTRCPFLGSLENGMIINPGRNRSIGATASFRCNSGYDIEGSETRTCQENGAWSGSLTVCVSDDTHCPALGTPLNGRKIGARYERNSEVRFDCNDGYALIGSRSRRCLENGEWDGEDPSCQSPNDFKDINVIGQKVGLEFARLELDSKPSEAELSGNNSIHGDGRFIPLTDSNGIDVYFMFDASVSVGAENFAHAKEFAKALVRKFNVSSHPSSARFGSLTFASADETAVNFHITDFNNTPDIIKAIGQIEYLGGGTNIGVALDKVETLMIPQAAQLGRPNSYKTLFLITDGKANEGGSPVPKARSLRNAKDMKIHVLGVSAEADRAELAEIASKPHEEYLFFLKNYGSLDELARHVTGEQNYSLCGVAGDTKASPLADDGNIVGGGNAKHGAWTFQAGIYLKKEGLKPSFTCGGSLISRSHVLTAAHCFGNNPPISTLEVYVGLTQRIGLGLQNGKNMQMSKVVNYTIHPNYDDSTVPHFDYDIAVIELETPFNLNPYVRTVCFPNKERADRLIPPEAGRRPVLAVATGWGHTEEKRARKGSVEDAIADGSYSNELRQATLPLKSFSRCNESLGNDRIKFTERMFCAGYGSPDNAEGLCQGDSGGPIMRKLRDNRWVQLGITSWGIGCGFAGQYDFFTHLPKFYDWVYNVTSGNINLLTKPK